MCCPHRSAINVPFLTSTAFSLRMGVSSEKQSKSIKHQYSSGKPQLILMPSTQTTITDHRSSTSSHGTSTPWWHWSFSRTPCAATSQGAIWGGNNSWIVAKNFGHQPGLKMPQIQSLIELYGMHLRTYNPLSAVGTREFTVSETMFGWVFWVIEHPHEKQDPGFPLGYWSMSFALSVSGCNVVAVSGEIASNASPHWPLTQRFLLHNILLQIMVKGDITVVVADTNTVPFFNAAGLSFCLEISGSTKENLWSHSG